MTIKMIAVDMDGTFLNEEKTYNRERFKIIFQQLKEKKIKFVVASGNQYDQLKSFFPELHREMSFVSEMVRILSLKDKIITMRPYQLKRFWLP